MHSAVSKVTYNDEYGIEESYVLANCNMEVKGKILHMPVYMIMFLQDDTEYPVLMPEI